MKSIWNCQADLFLRIHFNGFNGSARGVETLIRRASAGNLNPSPDRAFAKRVQKHVVAAIQARDLETRDRSVKSMRVGVVRDEHLGNTEQAPRCRSCLVEVEFIDMPAVNQLLSTGPDYVEVRRAIAAAARDASLEELE